MSVGCVSAWIVRWRGIERYMLKALITLTSYALDGAKNARHQADIRRCLTEIIASNEKQPDNEERSSFMDPVVDSDRMREARAGLRRALEALTPREMWVHLENVRKLIETVPVGLNDPYADEPMGQTTYTISTGKPSGPIATFDGKFLSLDFEGQLQRVAIGSLKPIEPTQDQTNDSKPKEQPRPTEDYDRRVRSWMNTWGAFDLDGTPEMIPRIKKGERENMIASIVALMIGAFADGVAK